MVPGGEKEWWDNNFGSNYRVAFVKKAAEVPVEEEEQREHGVKSDAGYRRNVAFSAPPREYVLFDLESLPHTHYQLFSLHRTLSLPHISASLLG